LVLSTHQAASDGPPLLQIEKVCEGKIRWRRTRLGFGSVFWWWARECGV